jgi:hypothetical protein
MTRKKLPDRDKIRFRPAMEMAAWSRDAVTFPIAVATVRLAPYFMPCVRANIMLGPGAIEARNTVTE